MLGEVAEKVAGAVLVVVVPPQQHLVAESPWLAIEALTVVLGLQRNQALAVAPVMMKEIWAGVGCDVL